MPNIGHTAIEATGSPQDLAALAAHVRGIARHWQPVRSRYKAASTMWRSSSTCGWPACLPGVTSGPRMAHSASVRSDG